MNMNCMTASGGWQLIKEAELDYSADARKFNRVEPFGHRRNRAGKRNRTPAGIGAGASFGQNRRRPGLLMPNVHPCASSSFQ